MVLNVVVIMSMFLIGGDIMKWKLVIMGVVVFVFMFVGGMVYV